MNIKVERTIYLELNRKEVELFSIMLKLALRRLHDWQKSSQDRHFKLVGEEVTSFGEERIFIEDLIRGISK